MKLYVGQKLLTIYGDIAEIVGIYDQTVKLLYKNQVITVKKYLISRIAKSSTIKENTRKHSINTEKNAPKVIESCGNCMERKNGNCFGFGHCDSYRPSPEISQEEYDRWPKYGDATYYRTRAYR